MALVLNGSANTIGGLAVGGLPDGIVDTDTLAANAVVTGKITNGTIATEDLADNSVEGAKIKGGEILAWISINASSGTPSARDSYNVSSITDVWAGQYTVNFTNNLPANYATIVTADGTYNGSVTSLGHNDADAAHTNVGNVKVECRGGNATLYDAETYNVVCIS